MSISAEDLQYLRRCVQLAREALAAGDEPFGSMLVSAQGEVLFEGRNCVRDGDETRHPEFEISKWSASNLTPAERAASTVYTSGEHCPMCSASHGWMGLGRIVYAASGSQLRSWLDEWGAPPGPVASLSINEVAPSVPTDGPAPELTEEIKGLQRARFERDTASRA